MAASLDETSSTRSADLTTHIKRLLFRNLFSISILAVSAGQSFLLGWAVNRFYPVPLLAFFPLVPLIYGVNRSLVTQEQRQHPAHGGPGLFSRLYFASAFCSFFCSAFLLLNAALWVAIKIAFGAISAEAMTIPATASVGSGIDAIFRTITTLGLSGIAFAFTYGYTIGQLRVKVRAIALPLRSAPSAWRGLKIVQISDIHVGQDFPATQLEAFVQRINGLDPDLICITGDIADAPSSDLDRFMPILGTLRARFGVFAILGNHDHYAGAARVIDSLRRHTEFTVLRDEQTALEIRGHRLHIIGLDDRAREGMGGEAHNPHLDHAIDAIDDDAPILLLCHRPDLFPYASDSGVDLMLSGHTHGGQIALPWFKGRTWNLSKMITPFDRGLFERNDRYLYVNCGLGVTAQRVRLCTPREITLIEIAPPEPA